ncbi:MAG: FG-GAP repeat domain-containing protein [Cyanobacteriota bacterium]
MQERLVAWAGEPGPFAPLVRQGFDADVSSSAAAELAPLEALGHAIDLPLQGGRDGKGDEGEIVSARLRSVLPGAARAEDNDPRWIDGGAQAALVIDGMAPSVLLNGSRAAAFAGSSSDLGLPDVGFYASPKLVDIDADGDLDAFIGTREGNTLFFRNGGSAESPAFAGSTTGFGLPDVGYFASPSFADIDADGDLDAFLGNSEGNILMFRNTGSATSAAFAGSSQGIGLPDVGANAVLSFADVDADGDLDALIGNYDGNILFFRNTGTATHAAFAGSSLGFGLPDVGFYASPQLVDMDADGDLDLFTGLRDGTTLFFRNTGTPSTAAFAGSSLGYGLPDVGSFASPTFADVDGDGDLDAFLGNREGNTLCFRNSGGGLGSSNTSGAYGVGQVITILVPFTEVVHVDTTGGVPSLLLETGNNDRSASYAGGSGGDTLRFTYTVQVGDSSADLDVASSGALQLNGATIRDGAGNNANLSLPSPGSRGSLGAQAALVIDGSTTSALTRNSFSSVFSDGSSPGDALSDEMLLGHCRLNLRRAEVDNDRARARAGSASLAIGTEVTADEPIPLLAIAADSCPASASLGGVSFSLPQWPACAGAGTTADVIGEWQGLTPAQISLTHRSPIHPL